MFHGFHGLTRTLSSDLFGSNLPNSRLITSLAASCSNSKQRLKTIIQKIRTVYLEISNVTEASHLKRLKLDRKSALQDIYLGLPFQEKIGGDNLFTSYGPFLTLTGLSTSPPLSKLGPCALDDYNNKKWTIIDEFIRRNLLCVWYDKFIF